MKNIHFRPDAASIVKRHAPNLVGCHTTGPSFTRAVNDGSVTLAGDAFRGVGTQKVIDDILNAPGLIVIPQDFSMQGLAREYIAYDQNSLIKIDTAALSRYLLGESKPRLSLKKKRELDWRFSRVVPAEFDRRHEQEEFGDKLVGISWWGVGNNQRRIMSLYRSVQGAELKAQQDLAFFRFLPQRMSKVDRGLGQYARLTKQERAEELARLKEYLPYHEKVKHLRGLRLQDIIEEDARPFAHYTGQSFQVPGRDCKYLVELTQIPANKPVGYEWELRGSCECDDARFSRNRRGSQDEDYRCKHQEAALHTARKLGRRYDYEFPDFPGVFPLEGLVDMANKLRYNSVIVDGSTRRALGAAEIENLLIKTVIAKGPQDYLTCVPQEAAHMRNTYLR